MGCIICGGSVIHSGGFLVCRDCGCVQGRDIRESSYTIKGSQDKPESTQYVSAPNSRRAIEYGSCIEISSHSSDDPGYELNPKERSKAIRLRDLQKRTSWNNQTTRLADAFTALEMTGQCFDLPTSIYDRTGVLLKKSIDAWESQNIHVLALACLVWSVREYEIPLGEDELFDQYVRRSFNRRFLKRAKFFLQDILGKPFPLERAVCFVPRYISILRHSPPIVEKTRERNLDPRRFFRELEKDVCSALGQLTSRIQRGRSPRIIAASGIYAVSSIREKRLLNMSDIGRLPYISEHAIKSQFYSLWQPLLRKSGYL